MKHRLAESEAVWLFAAQRDNRIAQTLKKCILKLSAQPVRDFIASVRNSLLLDVRCFPQLTTKLQLRFQVVRENCRQANESMKLPVSASRAI